jgi:F-type H+-transporting ATPase subunit b
MIPDFTHDSTAWVALSFVLFLLLIWFKGRRAIVGSIDSRIATVRAEIETAQNLRLEAKKLFEDYERKHLEAVRDAESIIKTAEKQALEIRKQAELDLADTIHIREKQLQDRMDRMKHAAREEMQRYAAELAIDATAGIIQEKLDARAKADLIERAIKNLNKNLH